MKKMKRRLSYILIAAFLLLSFQFGATGSAEAATGTWKKDSNGYYYKYSDGSYAKNKWVKTGNKWYYLKKNGYMQTGWAEIGKKWYFFNATGAMQTGWKSFGKTWYFFTASGAMQTGWKSFGSKWYFFTAEGVMQTGWKSFGKNWYYFGTEGVMQTGWKQIGGKWYFFNSEGVMQTGWKSFSGKWYYFKADGIMATGKQTIGGKTYTFNSDGVWQESSSSMPTAAQKKELDKFMGYFVAGFHDSSKYREMDCYLDDEYEVLSCVFQMRAFEKGIFPVSGLVIDDYSSDPKGRFAYPAYQVDAAKMDIILKNVFNLTDAQVRNLKSGSGSTAYYYNGYYYGVHWDGGGGATANVTRYDTWNDKLDVAFRYTIYGSDGRGRESGAYGFVKYKYYNGKGYWSIYGTDMGD